MITSGAEALRRLTCRKDKSDGSSVFEGRRCASSALGDVDAFDGSSGAGAEDSEGFAETSIASVSSVC